MNASTKTFLASIIILACSIGFAIGAFCFADRGFSAQCCPRHSECFSSHKPCACSCDYKCRKHHNKHFCDYYDNDRKNEFKKEHSKEFKKFDFKKNIDIMDSMLQVTQEQKKALEQNRIIMDSAFKELRHQKKNAEKALRDALDSNDDQKIAVAKAGILKAQEALLNHRIEGVKSMNKILTKEQQEKFKAFPIERAKKHHD